MTLCTLLFWAFPEFLRSEELGRTVMHFLLMFSPGLDVREEKVAECAAVDTLVNYACVH